MSKSAALRGLANVSFYAADLAAAERWYSEALGVKPYFSRPGYIEFRVGDYQHELGIIDSKYAPPGLARAVGGAIAYWHVDDLATTVDRLVALGATPLEPIVERGPGFVTASVVDPFGNVIGVMFNRHYLDIHAGAHSTPQAVH